MPGQREDAARSGNFFVFFHFYDGKTLESNEAIEVRLVPSIGEYLTLNRNSDWYHVDTVIHCAIKDADREFDAEVWLHKVDHLDVIGKIITSSTGEA